MTKADRPLAWSHSALKDFEGCNRRFHEVKILKKYPFVETAETKYGNEVHKAIEMSVKNRTPLPKAYAQFQPVVDACLRKAKGENVVVLAEHEMALKVDLTKTFWKDWDGVWVRGMADLLIVDYENYTAWVFDWKTGKNKYPDPDQLKLMACMVFELFPTIRRVKAALVFIVHDDLQTLSMQREEKDRHWQDYRERTARIEACRASGTWNPNKTGLCKKHCPVVSCEHNGNHH